MLPMPLDLKKLWILNANGSCYKNHAIDGLSSWSPSSDLWSFEMQKACQNISYSSRHISNQFDAGALSLDNILSMSSRYSQFFLPSFPFLISCLEYKISYYWNSSYIRKLYLSSFPTLVLKLNIIPPIIYRGILGSVWYAGMDGWGGKHELFPFPPITTYHTLIFLVSRHFWIRSYNSKGGNFGFRYNFTSKTQQRFLPCT